MRLDVRRHRPDELDVAAQPPSEKLVVVPRFDSDLAAVADRKSVKFIYPGKALAVAMVCAFQSKSPVAKHRVPKVIVGVTLKMRTMNEIYCVQRGDGLEDGRIPILDIEFMQDEMQT